MKFLLFILILIIAHMDIYAQKKTSWEQYEDLKQFAIETGNEFADKVKEDFYQETFENTAKNAENALSLWNTQKNKISSGISFLENKLGQQKNVSKGLSDQLLSAKTQLQNGIKSNYSSQKISSFKSTINDLTTKRVSNWKSVTNTKNSLNNLKETANNLNTKVAGMQNMSKITGFGAGILKFSDFIGAGFSSLGQAVAWTEGASSFKNVAYKTLTTTMKAGVIFGANAAAGAAAGSSAQLIATAATSYVFIKAGSYVYDKTVGAYVNSLMDDEYKQSNPNQQDAKALNFNRKIARRRRAMEKQKKQLTQMGKKLDKSIELLEAYIQQQKDTNQQIEEESKQFAQEEIKRETKEVPVITFVPEKISLKAGNTISVQIKIEKGLLPIELGGAIKTTIKDNTERNLIYFNWTPEKETASGFYDFVFSATSASGLKSSKILSIKVEETIKVAGKTMPKTIKTNIPSLNFNDIFIRISPNDEVMHSIDLRHPNVTDDENYCWLHWSGLSFHADCNWDYEPTRLQRYYGKYRLTLKGKLSNDGKTIEYITVERSNIRKDGPWEILEIEIRNVPITSELKYIHEELMAYSEGIEIASLITKFKHEGAYYDSFKGKTISYAHTKLNPNEYAELLIEFEKVEE